MIYSFTPYLILLKLAINRLIFPTAYFSIMTKLKNNILQTIETE